jgi:metal-dependent amidase/aminoacylase/carboxypeptidase family protein
MSSRGFTVTRHYLGLDTAWCAEFRRGVHGRVIGVNAEMDALPGIGHGCGHNLIAMAGVGIALALRAAMEKHNISGTVILLGTPGTCQLNSQFFDALPTAHMHTRVLPSLDRRLCSRGNRRR